MKIFRLADGRLVLCLFLLVLVVFAKTQLKVVRISEQGTAQNIVQTDNDSTSQSVYFEFNLEEEKDSGNDSEVLLYLSSSMDIIQTEPELHLKKQKIIQNRLPRKKISLANSQRVLFSTKHRRNPIKNIKYPKKEV